MPDHQHVFPASDRVAGALFNLDPTRIAVVPRPDGTVDPQHALLFEMLVGAYRDTKPLDARDEALRDLVEAHRRGLVLLPMSLIFERSCLGLVSKRRFVSIVRESEPAFADLREFIQADERTPFAGWKPLLVSNQAFMVWQILAAIRFAAGTRLETLEDFERDHVEAFIRLARPNGEWAEWLPFAARKGLQHVVGYLAAVRKDPHFGIAAVRATALTVRGARNANPFKHYAHLAWLDVSYETYLEQGRTLTKKGHRLGKRLLGEYFASLDEESVSDPSQAFGRRNMSGLIRFARTWSTPQVRIVALAKVHDYVRWLENDSRDDDGHPSIEGCLYPEDVENFNRTTVVPANVSQGSDVQARPMPMRYHLRLKEIIAGDDFAWPKSLLNEQDDRPLHWITVTDPETGRTRSEFCPVLARILLLQLDLPLRNVQVRRLDSGEGDERRWDPGTGRWSASRGPNAGHWIRAGAFNRERGVIHEIHGDGGTVTGLWVNSNKTQDRAALFDETAGYAIPWEHRDVLENLDAMRSWQERYNPVAGPLPHAELPGGIFDDDPSEEVRALIPDRFYLFRYPTTPGPRGREAPPSYKLCLQFFYDALDELERRLNAEDPGNPVTIITERDRAGAPKRSVFTLHGMRAATLTGLHVAGVPIEILSKVVAGHASILMTLKYLKFDPLHVNDILTEARVKAITDAKAEFPNFLRKSTFEQAVRMTARLSDDGLGQAKGAYAEPSAWGRMDIGLCPNGCTLCHVGGPAIQRRNDKGTDKSAYAPVPGGGRNCVRCRFFVTGVPFLIPLWSHSVAVLAKADAAARLAADRDRELRILKGERKSSVDRGDPVHPDLRERITVTEELMIAEADRRDQALADFHATLTLIEKVRAVAMEDPGQGAGDASVPMLLSAGEVPEVVARESSRFELCDAVVQASRCFPSLESVDLERERDAFLDQVLYRNGYVPITMAPLSASERRRAADAMSAFLLVELGAQEAGRVVEGRKTLADFGLQEALEDACRRAIGTAMPQLEARDRSRVGGRVLDVAAGAEP